MQPAALVEQRFPDALGSLLAGSTACGDTTRSSDVDLVVLLGGPPAPMRETDRIDGTLVEFFVQTDESFLAFAERERRLRRSPLVHMCAHGVVLTDRNGAATRLRASARALWEGGPEPFGPEELEDRRYRLTALLDDLADGRDPTETAAIAAAVVLDVADLALVSRGHWSGAGRWLMRRLRKIDDGLAQRLTWGLHAATDGDTAALVGCAQDELERAGGRLDIGYVRHA